MPVDFHPFFQEDNVYVSLQRWKMGKDCATILLYLGIVFLNCNCINFMSVGNQMENDATYANGRYGSSII